MANRELAEYIRQGDFSKIVIFTDANILNYYPNEFDFIDDGKKLMILLPISESAKTISVYERVCRQLLDERIDRNALIVNWGGGAVSDFGGFVASTFKRGVAMVNVPTTLLAMIDAAIGGKNALNVGGVKNMVGTFWLPKIVVSDTAFLNTLPTCELLNGLGELLKYALIGSADLWSELKMLETVSAKEICPQWIDFCRNFKEKIVAGDLYDTGERHVLNFGHTVGHALEALFAPNYSHGHAVALGCLVSTCISYRRNFLSFDFYNEVNDFVTRFYERPSLSEDIDKVMDFCRQDKKNSNGHINFILLESLGVAVETEISEDELREALMQCFS